MDTQGIVLENIVCEKPMRGDSLNKRWLYKFFANTFGLGIGFIIQMIVPRGLGPNAFGNFSFLSNFFSQVVAFFEMGSSTCFYTRLSQRPKEHGLVSFYIYFSGFVASGVLVFVTLAMLTATYPKFWPGQQVFYIYLAAGFGILSWIVQMLNNMTDAYGITVEAEKVKVLQKILAVFIIVSLYIFHQINLANYFYFQYVVLAFLIVSFIVVIKRGGYLPGKNFIISINEVKKYLKEFYDYSHPFVIYSFIGVFANIFDRWLLQIFGGSAQQGFFGFSFQVSALCFLFTGALTPLLMREFSISYAKKDLKEMGRLFQRYTPILLFITAFLTCFMASQAGAIIRLMGGERYSNSFWPLFIMAFYPIYQVYGQICGSVFFAADKIKLYCNVGIFFLLVGIPATYLFIAPKAFFGLDGGATGLATKTILMQVVSVNAFLYLNSRILRFSFRKYLFEQLFTIGLLLIGAFLASGAADFILGVSCGNLPKLLLAGLFYTSLVAVVIYFFPDIFAMRKDDIHNVFQTVLVKFNKIFKREVRR